MSWLAMAPPLSITSEPILVNWCIPTNPRYDSLVLYVDMARRRGRIDQDDIVADAAVVPDMDLPSACSRSLLWYAGRGEPR